MFTKEDEANTLLNDQKLLSLGHLYKTSEKNEKNSNIFKGIKKQPALEQGPMPRQRCKVSSAR